MTQLPERNTSSEYIVLLPAREPEKIRLMLPLAAAIARHQGGRVVVVGVVEVPADQPLSDGMLETRRVRADFDAAVNESEAGTPVRGVITVAHDLTDGIRTAVEEQGANLVLLGWQAEQSSS